MKEIRNLLWLSLLLLVSSSKLLAQQQNYTVKGLVLDVNKEPIPGVVIKAYAPGNRTTQISATSSDGDGNFAFSNLNANSRYDLVFSGVGYESYEELNVSTNSPESSKLEIYLKLENKVLEEVVIVGYATQKKANVSGAVNQVSSKVLENRPVANLGAGLQGTMPNLIVTNGNAPGQGASFNIRGTTSLSGGSPLILVDGVVQDPNLVNPNDVASVTTLSDAASASIYGSRAAFGVILITTKSGGKNQPATVNFSSSYGSNELTRIPKYMNSLDFVNYMNTASVNDGRGMMYNQRIIDAVTAHYNDPSQPNVIYDPSIETNGKYTYVGNTDWTRELYKNGSIQQNNVSISGGSSTTKYFLSYGNSIQKGFLKSYDDYYKRYNISSNVTTDLSKWLIVSGRIRYTHSNEDHPSGGSVVSNNSGISAYGGQLKNDLQPLMPIKHPDGNWAGQGSYTNPFAVGAEGGYNQSKINDLWLTGAVILKPFEGFNVNADYTFNSYSNNNDVTSRRFREYHANGNFNIYPWTNPSTVQMNNSNDYYRALNIFGDYSKSIANNNFKLLVGFNQEDKALKFFRAQRRNLIDDNFPALNLASGEQSTTSSQTSWAVQGYFYRLNYDFNNKYFLEVNGRYDGTSKFRKGERFVFSPSFSGAWRVSEEGFWKSSGLNSWFNEFKIKGSYGTLGNQAVSSNFPYLSLYSTSGANGLPYILGSTSSLPASVWPGGLVSPNFTWEKVNQFNVGATAEFFANRLSVSYDYFTRNTIGMLVSGAALPAVLGTNPPTENAADLQSKGFDFVLSWRDNLSSGISYRASFILSNADAYITKFSNPTGNLGNYYVGRRIGEIWGFHSDGLFQSDAEVTNHNQTELTGIYSVGDVKYKDLDGDGKVSYGQNTLENHGDQRIIGNTQSRFNYGIRSGVTWKGWDLDLFFQGVAKKDFVPDARFYGTANEWSSPMQLASDFWTPENTDAFLPRPLLYNGRNTLTTDRYLQNAAYLRLKQVTLSHNFKVTALEKINIRSLQLYFTGQNLLTFTKLSKLYDPENTNLMGYPVTKSYSFGINLTLR